jgi:ribonuclease HI
MLQQIPLKVTSFLTNIYQSVIKLEYIPTKWCESKAIFIPKNNKLPKSDPKAYRPICLSNVIFKVLEKLIQTNLERLQIYPAKLSHRQHGFRSNKSTLTALSELTNFIEWGFQRQEITVATFLDIHGAFDNINPIRALNKLEQWQAPKAIVNTLKNYYQKRKILTQLPLSNKNMEFYPTKGTAQGNVLSPMLWNCVVDQVGSIMDKHKVGGCLFADDVAIAVSHANIDTPINLTQKVLDDIRDWAQMEGLQLNVSKTHYLIFNNKNNNPHTPLTWYGHPLNIQDSTKYLGVLLNNNLRWTDHFDMVFDRAKRDMVLISKALHKRVGPSPKLTHWIYTGIIRPKITYAAHIWCGKISNSTLDKKSRQIQRWALIKLGPIREHTPTAGLEILTKTTPLHIHLQEVALKTLCNFKNSNFQLKAPLNGHLAKWIQILHHHLPLTTLPCDKTVKKLSPQFLNKIPDPQTNEGATIYMDGSKMGPDCGSGFIIEWGKESRMGMVYNGQFQSVFLSEIRAISMAVEKFLSEKVQTPIVKIYTDCKSAIAALRGKYATSKIVQQCWTNLTKLDNAYKWSLSWVKAHVGIRGNEKADNLAKQASQLKIIGPQPILPIAPNYLRQELINFSNRNWETYWNERADCRQTKLWFPKPNVKEAKNLLNLPKKDFGLMVRWLTGHCFLARHEALISNNGDPVCNKCFLDDQTPWHLIKECPATLHLRKDLPHDQWITGTLIKIIKNIEHLEVNHLLHLLPPTPNNL